MTAAKCTMAVGRTADTSAFSAAGSVRSAPSDVEPVPAGEPVAASEPSGLLVIGLDVEVGGHHIVATGQQGADQLGTHQAESSCDEYAIS